ncbi:hypothetical protein ACVMAJ_006890 [Bradyrhizobium sp. USDA 4448]
MKKSGLLLARHTGRRPPRAHDGTITADLAELDRLAERADAEKLRSAIDDHAEQLTGDRTKLHAGSSSIG